MPPTLLYNEGWLLRGVLHWFSQHRDIEHSLSFLPGSEWYSEGMLSSTFLPAFKGDKLAESYTHADGVIGSISVGEAGREDVSLVKPYEQFIVLEAKLFSPLSKGTKNAPNYDQAARIVACMANLLSLSSCSIHDLNSSGFYVLSPENQVALR